MQKALGVRGRLLQRGPELYLAITVLSVYSPLMQHLCLHGFQACCFGEHAVVNMAVCGRTYERTSTGDWVILSVYQGELRGDCLSISSTVCDILDMTATVKLIWVWIHLSESAIKACLKVSTICQERSLLSYWISELNMQVEHNINMKHLSLADNTLMATLKVFYSCTQKQLVFEYDGIMAICECLPHFQLWIWRSAEFCRI